MKNLICMGICLLALLLALVCTAASAQEYYTLPEIREQAAQGWHETYTDKYGRCGRWISTSKCSARSGHQSSRPAGMIRMISSFKAKRIPMVRSLRK